MTISENYEAILISDMYKVKLVVVNTEMKIYPGTIDCIKSILELYSHYFPELKIINFTIIIDPDYPNPYYEYSTRNIYLKTYPANWSQIAYQFCHELCHLVINNQQFNKILWFEESISEMASYYFMEELSNVWKKSYKEYLSCDNKPYYNSFKEYVDNDKKKATFFNIASLKKDINLLNKLNENGINREYNANIAIQMLPIFKLYPGLWKTITCFKNIQSNDDLETFLIEWNNLSPKYLKRGMKEIMKLFNITVNRFSQPDQVHQ